MANSTFSVFGADIRIKGNVAASADLHATAFSALSLSTWRPVGLDSMLSQMVAAIDAAVWEEVARVRHSAGPDDSSDFSYVTYHRRGSR